MHAWMYNVQRLAHLLDGGVGIEFLLRMAWPQKLQQRADIVSEACYLHQKTSSLMEETRVGQTRT